MTIPEEHQQDTFSQLVEHPQSHKETLIAEWVAQVRRDSAVPSKAMTNPEIVDHIPIVFDALIQAIKQYRGDTTIEQARQVAAQHTIIRWAENYDLPAVLREISLLRSAFIHYLSDFEDEHEPVDSKARLFTSTTIHIILDEIVLDATELFLKLRGKDET